MRAAVTTLAIVLGYSFAGYADHELRKSIFESLGPTAWGMYILIPIPFIVLGAIGYFVYRAWKASARNPEEGPHPQPLSRLDGRGGEGMN